jgi:uncharacterized protein YcbX
MAASNRVLAEIRLFPVKSLAGVTASAAAVEPWGLLDDRRWLLLDPDGSVLTAREEHRLLAFRASPAEDGAVELVAPDASTLHVSPPVDGAPLPTSLSRLESVIGAGDEVDDWLSSRLDRPVRLGWLDDPRRRTVSEAHGGRPGDVLSLADAGPLLLTTTSSLRQLDALAGERFAMTRFRPNVVVDGPDDLPFAEDSWSTVWIGDVEFRFGEHCDRCVLTTIYPETQLGGKEPLRTLAKHRQWSHKTWFGIRIIPVTPGTIHVGDTVTSAEA